MTSLKVKYANEIAEAMAKSLGDEEFINLFHKTASIEKEASPEYDEFVKKFKEYQDAPGPGGKENVRDKAEDALNRVKDPQEKATGENLIKTWYEKEQQAGIKTEPKGQLAEDCMSADCMEGMLAKDCCPECGEKKCMCDKQSVAAEFALNHLVKLADTLDKRGFNMLANMIDEATLKVAKKKEKSEDKKKSEKDEKKSEKDEKKSEKDEKKSEKDEKKSEKDEKKSEKDEKKSGKDE